MPSPVAHGILGMSWALVCLMPHGQNFSGMLRRIWIDKWGYVLVVGVSLIPDIDYVPGLVTGSLNAFHQVTTHSLSWCTMMSVGVLLLVPQIRNMSVLRWWGVLWLGMMIHLFADVCTVDLGAPVGSPLLWPFSSLRFNGPVLLFLPLSKETLNEAWQGWNGLVLGWEFLLTVPIFWMVWMAKQSGHIAPWMNDVE